MASILSVFCALSDILDSVRRVSRPPFRPKVQVHDTNEESLADLMMMCWEEIPEFRPNFNTIRDGLKKMSSQGWGNKFDGHGPWWRHQMETFSALLALFVGNSPVNGEFPSQGPVTRSFYVFFDLCLNRRLSKESWGWGFETPSRSLWRHCNVIIIVMSSLSRLVIYREK